MSTRTDNKDKTVVSPSLSDPADSSDKLLEVIMSALSHDVRTPARHTEHFLNFMERDLDQPLNEKSEEHLAIARESLVKVGDMIEALVAFGRLHQLHKPEPGQILQDIVDVAIGRVRTSTQNESVELLVECPPVTLRCDHAQLVELFMCLFENAILFSDASRDIIISLSTDEANSDQIQLYVEDNGPGMQFGHEGVFRPFLKTPSQNPVQGLGMGLTVARRIAEIHGGSLTFSPVASRFGGARFILQLPA